MIPRMNRRVAFVALVLTSLASMAACSGDGTGSPSTTFGGEQPVAPVTAPANGGPAIVRIAADVTAPCTAASTTATVTFTIAPANPAKYVSFAIDGRQTTARVDLALGSAIVDGLPCDGAAHSIMLLATDAAGTSDARGIAVRTPTGA
jgi:hypothetical protein